MEEALIAKKIILPGMKYKSVSQHGTGREGPYPLPRKTTELPREGDFAVAVKDVVTSARGLTVVVIVSNRTQYEARYEHYLAWYIENIGRALNAYFDQLQQLNVRKYVKFRAFHRKYLRECRLAYQREREGGTKAALALPHVCYRSNN